ncbi:hypothetical protein [Calditerricola satsumensis]|uniref:Uncharacterized protein n=1 Tax=Calditerricola satsumensis TaxID=373054 RepID=A0A8J3FBM5_9BACI|nr:hypothetical protein [Calditerricola satsumensis]GGK02288.1 hypothetical protein GCM10007043_15450 [Calditerricola satsumensis]
MRWVAVGLVAAAWVLGVATVWTGGWGDWFPDGTGYWTANLLAIALAAGGVIVAAWQYLRRQRSTVALLLLGISAVLLAVPLAFWMLLVSKGV